MKCQNLFQTAQFGCGVENKRPLNFSTVEDEGQSQSTRVLHIHVCQTVNKHAFMHAACTGVQPLSCSYFAKIFKKISISSHRVRQTTKIQSFVHQESESANHSSTVKLEAAYFKTCLSAILLVFIRTKTTKLKSQSSIKSDSSISNESCSTALRTKPADFSYVA